MDVLVLEEQGLVGLAEPIRDDYPRTINGEGQGISDAGRTVVAGDLLSQGCAQVAVEREREIPRRSGAASKRDHVAHDGVEISKAVDILRGIAFQRSRGEIYS